MTDAIDLRELGIGESQEDQAQQVCSWPLPFSRLSRYVSPGYIFTIFCGAQASSRGVTGFFGRYVRLAAQACDEFTEDGESLVIILAHPLHHHELSVLVLQDVEQRQP